MKKITFELNEKVLRSSFKINFGDQTARVLELKKNLPYYVMKLHCSSRAIFWVSKFLCSRHSLNGGNWEWH